MSLLQYEALAVWIAHIATLLDLLGLEPADGGVEHADPHLALLEGVSRELKHSVDHYQVKTIHLVILRRKRERRS